MKRLLGSEVPESDELTSVEIHVEVRTAFAKQYIAWKARGLKKADFLAFLSESGYTITERTLSRWVAGVKQQGTAVSQTVGGNRERALSEEETRMIVGFVIDRNLHKLIVHLDTVQTFIHDYFHKEVSLSTVHNYLHANGISSRVTVGRSDSLQLDFMELAQIAFQWLQTSPLHCPRSLLCSVDFTFTSHRTDRVLSYALKGGPRPKSESSISRYTNCIVTCVWADGIDRTPSVLLHIIKNFE